MKMFRALFHWPGVLAWLLLLPTFLLVVILIGRWQINRAADATLVRIDELYAEHGVPTDASVFALEGDGESAEFLRTSPEIAGGFMPFGSDADYSVMPEPTHRWPNFQIALARWMMSWHEEDWDRVIEQHEKGFQLGYDPFYPVDDVLIGARDWGRIYRSQATLAVCFGEFEDGIPWIERMLALAEAILVLPDFNAQIVGISIIATATEWIEDELSRVSSQPEDLRVLANRLELAARNVDVGRSFAVQLALLHPQFEGVSKTLDDRASYLDYEGDPEFWLISGETEAIRAFEVVRMNWPQDDDLENDETLFGLRAHWLRLRALRRLAPRYFEAELCDPMVRFFEMYDDFPGMTPPDWRRAEGSINQAGNTGHWSRTLARFEDRITVAVAALRAEADRLEHGRWPAESELGLDRYGRPLRLRELDNGWLVYSVSLDGVDQMGYWQRALSHNPPADAETPEHIREGVASGRHQSGFDEPSWDDQSFRIYLPEVRGQPAAAWPP